MRPHTRRPTYLQCVQLTYKTSNLLTRLEPTYKTSNLLTRLRNYLQDFEATYKTSKLLTRPWTYLQDLQETTTQRCYRKLEFEPIYNKLTLNTRRKALNISENTCTYIYIYICFCLSTSICQCPGGYLGLHCHPSDRLSDQIEAHSIISSDSSLINYPSD